MRVVHEGGAKSGAKSLIRARAANALNRASRRPVSPLASRSAAIRIDLGSGRDSSFLSGGRRSGRFPFSLPAAARISLSSNKSHASNIRTGKIGRTPPGIPVILLTVT